MRNKEHELTIKRNCEVSPQVQPSTTEVQFAALLAQIDPQDYPDVSAEIRKVHDEFRDKNGG